MKTVGPAVPDELVMQRFSRNFQNLRKVIPLTNFILLIDNIRETRHRVFGSIIHAVEPTSGMPHHARPERFEVPTLRFVAS
jgi:predicted ABC-type ATPase